MRRGRRPIAAALVASALGACGPPGGGLSAAETEYLGDAGARRHALEASLVNPANAYSTLRLARYASGDADDWDLLPAWNPRAAPVALAELDATPGALPLDARALAVDDDSAAAPPSAEALRALGEAAFFRYPAQLAPLAAGALSRTAAARYGLWLDGARGVGGLVRAEAADGRAVLAFSCATCHADIVAGRLVAGVPSAHLDVGLMLLDAGSPAPDVAERLAAWGPGRVDVTTNDGSMPERISDLRPVRWLSHLQYDATVRQADVVALAIRLETLVITAHGQSVRPPRLVALALARYLWDLAATLGASPPPSADGARLFASRCGACHAGEGLTGAPRPLAEIGTDATLGLSPERGTGLYRVPSLRGVGSRPSLLHDGTLADVAALLDPARLSADYARGPRGDGAVGGHAFGLELTIDERAALAAFLRGL
jgi:cytochrome c5